MSVWIEKCDFMEGKTVSDTTIYRGYLCVTDIPKDHVTLQKGETIAFRWVDEREFREIFYSDQYVDGLRERLHGFVEHDFQKETHQSG